MDTTEQLKNNSNNNNNKGRLETVEGVFEKVLIQWPKLLPSHVAKRTQAQREEFKLSKNQDIDFDTLIMFYRKLTLDSSN